MTLQAWRTSSFSHTQENQAFNRLYGILCHHWRQNGEPLHLLGNVCIDGCKFDAILIKRNALIVIDFEDYGGDLRFSLSESVRYFST